MVNRAGLSGVLFFLLWRDGVIVNVRSSYRFYIDVIISYQGILPSHFLGNYGDPDSSQRHNTWEMVRRLCFAGSGPTFMGEILTKY